jgi:hypothetical protein
MKQYNPCPPPKVSINGKRSDVFLDFDDGSLLMFSTYKENGMLLLDYVALYRNSKLEAFDAEKLMNVGFGSFGNVSQQDLGNYWEAAYRMADNYSNSEQEYYTLFAASAPPNKMDCLLKGTRPFIQRKPVRIRENLTHAKT